MKFDLNKLSGEDAKSLVKSLGTAFQATIQNQQSSSEKYISTLVLDLSIARTRTSPLKISFPFVSLRVEEATDNLSNCRVIPVTIDSYQDDTLLKLNDSLEFDNGISSLYITNTAQTGKTMIIKFYTNARVRSGQLNLSQASAPPMQTIGEAYTPLDGFTSIKMFYINALTATTVSQFSLNASNELNTNHTGNCTINSVNIGTHYKIPLGYTAQLVGCEITADSAMTATNWGIFLSEVADGSTYATESAVLSAPVNVANIIIGGGFNPAIGISTKKMIDNDYFNFGFATGISPSRGNRTFLPGKVVVPIVRTTATGGGSCFVRLAFRLTPIVGT